MESWDENFPSLERGKEDHLDVSFSEEEICRELMSADGNKALGPNGFTFKLVQNFWPELKEKMFSLFQQFSRQPSSNIDSLALLSL